MFQLFGFYFMLFAELIQPPFCSFSLARINDTSPASCPKVASCLSESTAFIPQPSTVSTAKNIQLPSPDLTLRKNLRRPEGKWKTGPRRMSTRGVGLDAVWGVGAVPPQGLH